VKKHLIKTKNSLQCAPVPRGSGKNINQVDVLISYLLPY